MPIWPKRQNRLCHVPGQRDLEAPRLAQTRSGPDLSVQSAQYQSRFGRFHAQALSENNLALGLVAQ